MGLNILFSKGYDWRENCEYRGASAARCRQDVQRDLQNPTPSDRNGSRGFAGSGRLTGDDVDTLRALLEEEAVR
jgi:hypothetical protein